MNSFTGTWRLIRLALRRDRIKLPVVILALLGMFAASVAATIEFYDTLQKQITYAATNAPSVVGRVFGGPIDGPNIGSIVLNETFVFTALMTAFISTLTIVRHTRQNEEYGRSELIESGVVSRYASLFAAMAVATLVNVIIAVFIVLSLLANDLPMGGSVAYGVAIGAIGMTFAAIAAVAAQLADSSRGANGMCALAIGVLFLLRGVGDAMGNLANNGMAVQSSFISWLSPFGWGQQIYPYTQSRLWIFTLFFVLFAVLVSIAVVFMARRDIGMGMLPARLGPAKAKQSLLSPFGLAWRLQKGILRGWFVAIAVLSASYGLVINEFKDLLADNEELSEALGELGGNITDSFLSVMVAFMTLTIAGFAMQAILRLRSEEANGQVESILSAGVSRTRWMMSHISFVAIGIVILVLTSGLSMGIAFILTSGESWSKLWSILTASYAQSSAVFALTGFVVAAYSLLPRFAVMNAWGSLSACLLVMQLGVLLKFPQWVLNISPFAHHPAMPAQSFKWLPVASLMSAAVLLTLAGITYFNRRDIVTN